MKIKVLLFLALMLTIPMLVAPAARAWPNPTADPDIDGDTHYVTILDVTKACSQFMLTGGDRDMTIVAKADFDNDGVVTMLDLVTLITMWRKVP